MYVDGACGCQGNTTPDLDPGRARYRSTRQGGGWSACRHPEILHKNHAIASQSARMVACVALPRSAAAPHSGYPRVGGELAAAVPKGLRVIADCSGIGTFRDCSRSISRRASLAGDMVPPLWAWPLVGLVSGESGGLVRLSRKQTCVGGAWLRCGAVGGCSCRRGAASGSLCHQDAL